VVSDKVSLLATDAWSGYEKLNHKYPHASVDHHKRQYVIGAVHTNTIEGFWSIFKRGVVGTFHKVSAKYMPLYVAEFQFRYNNQARRIAANIARRPTYLRGLNTERHRLSNCLAVRQERNQSTITALYARESGNSGH